MILDDGIDTATELETSAKFDGDPMTVYLWSRWRDGDIGDDMLTWSDGSGMIRFGRRVLTWESAGFVWSRRYDTAEEAAAGFAELRRGELNDLLSTIGDFAEAWEEITSGRAWWVEESNVDEDELLAAIEDRLGPPLPEDTYSQAWELVSRPGLVWRIIRPSWENYVRAVAVGDDRVERVDLDDLVPLDDTAYCAECGQIGCTHDGRDRSDDA